MRPYLKKKKSQKRTGIVVQGVGPEFKPQYHKKKVRGVERGRVRSGVTMRWMEFGAGMPFREAPD
jgi:hypothetical protein